MGKSREAAYEDPWNPKSCSFCGMMNGHATTCRNLTVPVQHVDLTDDEIVELIEKHWDLQRSLPDFARAVIAADREKNK